MRILHSADWHLGHAQGKLDRLEEQQALAQEIVAIARAEQVDLVLLAGDVYDTFNPPAAAERVFFHTLDELAEDGRRAIVVIAGNHEMFRRFYKKSQGQNPEESLLRLFMELATQPHGAAACPRSAGAAKDE